LYTARKLLLGFASFVNCRMETLKKASICSVRMLKGWTEVKNLEEEWEEEEWEEEGEEEWEEEEW